MIKDYLRLVRLDKPIGTLLLLWPTLMALVIASHGFPKVYTIIVFTLGVFLTRSAGCAINDIADQEFDKNVARTKNRPLAKGSISKFGAILFAIILILCAFILSYKFLHRITLFLSIPALLLFVSYPYLKRFFPLPQVYLGIAFSFGILMAFVEVTGRVNSIAFMLFFANLFWVVGYDTIYALVDIEDDLKIGIKTSAITFGKFVIPVIAFCYVMFFLLLFWMGAFIHLNVFYYIGLSLSGGMLIYQIILLLLQDKEKYLQLFLLNNWVGFVLFLGTFLGVFG